MWLYLTIHIYLIELFIFLSLSLSLYFILNLPFSGHINNLHDTCLWMLVKEGETEKEAQEFLKVLIFSLFMHIYVYVFYMHILVVLIPPKKMHILIVSKTSW
jgi:hypothetical protein